MAHKYHIGHKVRVVRPPVLAPEITPGTPGEIVELRGYRAFGIRFAGQIEPRGCFPEEIERVASTTLIAPPPALIWRRRGSGGGARV